jgi:hypothetical protein
LQRHRGCIDTAPPQTLQRQDWVSAVKVGFADGNVEAFEPGGISGQPTPFRRNAPQKQSNCSAFILHLQQNIAVQPVEGEGFLPGSSLQPLASKGFFT